MLSKKSKAIFFTLLAGALWGTSFPIIKIGLETIDPFTFVFWRFLVSAITLLVVMLALRKLKAAPLKSYPYGSLLGLSI